MKLLAVAVDMNGMSEYEQRRLPGKIDVIVKPHHLKWFFRNIYFVEEGYDEDIAVYGAKKALEETDWLKNIVFVSVFQPVERCRLDEIDIGDMSEPKPEKMDKYREYFEEHGISEYELTYPNPIVIDQNKRLLDGYTSYLIMKEKGFTYAECILADGRNNLNKYICGVHLPEKSGKVYRWAYFLRDAVVPGDELLVDTCHGKQVVRVTDVGMGTSLFVNSLKKARKLTEKRK